MSTVRLPALALLLLLAPSLGGCAIVSVVAAAGDAIEKEKKIEVPAAYADLQDRTVAVLVQADMSTYYEHPMVPGNIALNVANRIQSNVPGVKVRDPREIMSWQYQTPGWMNLPLGEIAKELDVDRVVYVDLYEYRLNPPGNRWIWEGVAAGSVGIIERDGVDPDSFADTFNVSASFPDIEGLGRDSATESQIQTGLLVRFIEETSWLFYTSIRPKYPDA